jgi:hypothetical protein
MCVAGKWEGFCHVSNGSPIESEWSPQRKRGEPRPAPVAIHRRLQRGENRRGGLEPRGRNEDGGWHRGPEGGQLPGVDAQQVNRRRGTQRTDREEGPIRIVRRFGECTVDCRKEEARSRLPRGQAGKPVGGRRDRAGRVVPGWGETPEETASSTRCAGQPATSSRRASRASARWRIAAPAARCRRRPVASGNAEESAAGRGAFARPPAEEVDPRRRPPRVPLEQVTVGRPSTRVVCGGRDLGRDWIRPERGRKRQTSSRGAVARRCCFSARAASAIPRSGQPPRASWKTAKAEGGAAKANEPRTDRKTVRRPVATLAAASPAFPEGPSDFPVRHAAGQPAARATPRVSSWCSFPSVCRVG